VSTLAYTPTLIAQEVAAMKQLALPLQNDPSADPALRRAWIASRLHMPFHIAISTPAIAICLRRMAATENRRCATR